MNTIFNNINNLNVNNSLSDGDYFEYVIEPTVDTSSGQMQINGTYDIRVKDYMTKKSNSNFDFMLEWNNNIPMPGVIARGKVIDETRGMYKMKLQTPDNKSWTGWIIKTAIVDWSTV